MTFKIKLKIRKIKLIKILRMNIKYFCKYNS